MTSAEVIADLVRKHRSGTPLWIDHPFGGQRVIAEVLPTATGFLFADVSWTDPLYSGHPFHRVDGTARDAGSVIIDLTEGGQAEVFEFGEYDPPKLVDNLAEWRAYLASPAGRGYGGAAGVLANVKRDLAPDARLDDG